MGDGLHATTIQKISIDHFVKELRKLKEHDFSSVETPLGFLQRHPVDAESIAPYIHWDAQHYTRNLIDKTELYELIAVCWEVGMKPAS